MTLAFKLASPSLIVALSLVLVTPRADARSVPSLMGSADTFTDANCFVTNFATGTLIRTCNSNGPYTVPLPIDNFNTKNVSITVRNTVADTIACEVRSHSQNENNMISSPTVKNVASAGFTTLTFAPVTVPNQGRLDLHCTVGFNSQLGVILYNQ